MFMLILWLVCQCLASRYAIVVDAGSTSSKLHIYHWTDLSVDVTELYRAKPLAPGIEEYAKNATYMVGPFTQYLKESLVHLPVEGKSLNSQTPIFIGATAGLRLLPTDEAENLLEVLRGIIIDHFPFLLYERRNVRVLSGEEEGIFGWLTVQYLLKNFDFKHHFGALDMGGASTQLTFSPSQEEIIADKITARVFSRVVDVYTHSLLRFGNNEAFKLSKAELRMKIPGDVVDHPCLMTGDNVKDGSVTFRGTSDAPACLALIDEILHLNQYCFFGNSCSVNSAYMPKIPSKLKFYAFSGFYYVLDGFDVKKRTALSLNSILNITEEFCRHNYEWGKNHSHFKEIYVSQQCFNAFFAAELLINGYNFDPHSTEIDFIEEINGKQLGWTLGLLLYENQFMDLSGESGSSMAAYQVATVVLSVVTAIALLVIVGLVIALVVLILRNQSKEGNEWIGKATSYNRVS